ncbi:MAG: hypothetical protein HY756_01855 [Nitrospirae bacterium]|nr:hypothetical protein [Nitrospirota bacterium]
MLNYSELKQLSALGGNGNMFVSLYLNVISSAPLGFWREYNLSLPVKNEIVVDSTPYIKPLAALLSSYPRYIVLVADKESARLFLIHLGRIEIYTEHVTPDIPGKHKKGGWFALEQGRYERHIDFHISQHMKDVIKSLEELLIRESADRIILGGSEETLAKVKNMLPHTILDKVIATFHPEKMSGGKDILNETLCLIEGFERNKEKEIVEDLITRAMKGNMAVIGLEDVLTNIRNGKVMNLIFLKDLSTTGFKCKNCGLLTSHAIKACPYCSGTFEDVNYLIDLAAQKAVEQGATIDVISDSTELARAGGIGAILRF